MSDIDIVYGDKNFKLKFVIKDAVGNLEDLTQNNNTILPAGLSVELHVKKYGGGSLYTFDGDWGDWPNDPDDPDPSHGEVRFSMGTIIWDGAGDYEAEIEVTYPDGSVVTVPDLIIHVLEELG